MEGVLAKQKRVAEEYIRGSEQFKGRDLELIDIGCEDIVFRLGENRKVVKVDKDYFTNLLFESEDPSRIRENNEKYREKLKRYKEEEKVLERYFGNHLLKHSYFRQSLSFTKSDFVRLFSEFKDERDGEVGRFLEGLPEDWVVEILVYFKTQEKMEAVAKKEASTFEGFLIRASD